MRSLPPRYTYPWSKSRNPNPSAATGGRFYRTDLRHHQQAALLQGLSHTSQQTRMGL